VQFLTKLLSFIGLHDVDISTPKVDISDSWDERVLTPAQWIELLYRSRSFDRTWFAPEILNRVSPRKVRRQIQRVGRRYGALQTVVSNETEYIAKLKRALIPMNIGFDAEGRIAELVIKPQIPRFSDVNEVQGAFTRLPGQTSLLVEEDGVDVLALHPDRLMAVGSAFKLVVMSAVTDAVDQGRFTWERPVSLKPSWRALPTGILEHWPAGTLVTPQTLADLMISLSDNTAAEALIQLVGRDDLEAISPQNRPFLSTREFFILKSVRNRRLRQRYVAAGEPERRTMLDIVNTLGLPEPAEVSRSVIPEIGWRFTSRQLCALICKVHSLRAMHINPGIAARTEWQKIAFKGGSDRGVLNLTTWLQARNGRCFAVAATWNDDKLLDEQQMISPYAALLDWLHLRAETATSRGLDKVA
jgi:Beta-lactamase enzyme family